MRVLVTGPRGFVGARIMDELGRDAIPAPSLRSVDEEDVLRIVDAAEPDLIIHTAAISDIPACEKDPDGSYRANVEIPVWLARTGVKCVMFSTDQVYSGCAGEGPYPEEETAPSNLYSRHKLEMEQRTLDINPDTVLLRATWMYDMPKLRRPQPREFSGQYAAPDGYFLFHYTASRRHLCTGGIRADPTGRTSPRRGIQLRERECSDNV